MRSECRDIRESLDAFVHEELVGKGRRRIEGHLEGCEVCSGEAARMRGLGGLLRESAGAAEARVDFAEVWHKVGRRVELISEGGEPGLLERFLGPLRRAWIPAVSVAAVLILLLASPLMFDRFGSEPQRVEIRSIVYQNAEGMYFTDEDTNTTFVLIFESESS